MRRGAHKRLNQRVAALRGRSVRVYPSPVQSFTINFGAGIEVVLQCVMDPPTWIRIDKHGNRQVGWD